ncbi:alpha/beta hydrolase [Cupriavidus plantarum]|uniref:alpha/beta hydrolase n=1 Tax=Cupriavidus plantarum TaxID=942865 RepID=UPI001AFCD447|nr:alpha/beta hydrolase [Cupriavidus plantarum]CAG2134637.1 hypothetical protein LMG26296_02060 [Cupriavidus plantarum]SMR84444.1 hypothetical protein SAMN05421735_3231 [Cupriavidus plantarum]
MPSNPPLNDLGKPARAASRLPPARAAALLALLAAAAVGRQLLFRSVERAAFNTCADNAITPEQMGAPSVSLKFASGDRTLHGCFVQATAPNAPALCVFHGNSECLSDWAPVQALLHAAGISSFVFDYSGYGSSTGRPTVRNLREDAKTAYAHFRAATPRAVRHYVLGYSLGSGILLDVLHRLQPAPVGAIIGAGFSSARAAAVATGRVPGWMAWMLPDPWDNAARVCRLKMPLMLLHSRIDATIPYSHGQKLARVARCANRLVTFEDLPHNAATNPDWLAAFWAPVIPYLRSDELGEPTAAR